MNLDHVALCVEKPKEAAKDYCENYGANLIYADDTWSMIEFDNIKIAFVISNQHPPHIAFAVDKFVEGKTTKSHRDGSESYYESDGHGNFVEFIKYPED
mgnify:CR=1 FL=1